MGASFVISGGVLYYFNSWTAALASFLTGVFIDIDHILDYYVNYGINLDIRRFFDVCYSIGFRKLFLFLHSFELVAGLWFFVLLLNPGTIWTGAAIGITQHLFLDQLGNNRTGCKKFRYFLLYRLRHSFSRSAVIENEKTYF